MTTTSRIILVECVALLLRIYAQPSSRLTGRVVADESGKPLAGVTVLATQRIAPGPPVILRVLTDGDGSYAIDNAAAGAYNLCFHAGTAYLDPCDWGAPIRALAGGPAQEIRLRLG